MSIRTKVHAILVVGSVLTVGLLFSAPPAQAGGGCHMTDFTDQRGIQVDLKQACFTPTVLRVLPGQTVTFLNADDITHTVTGAAGSWGTYEDLQPHASVTYQFASSGVFPYFCAIHPGMVGAVLVGDGSSSKTTTEDVVPVVPTVAPSQAAPAANTSGVSSTWRTVAIAGFALILGVAGLMAGRGIRFRRRRATVRA
jgi:plastocyanin